jgi:hypothetical protein
LRSVIREIDLPNLLASPAFRLSHAIALSIVVIHQRPADELAAREFITRADFLFESSPFEMLDRHALNLLRFEFTFSVVVIVVTASRLDLSSSGDWSF